MCGLDGGKGKEKDNINIIISKIKEIIKTDKTEVSILNG